MEHDMRTRIALAALAAASIAATAAAQQQAPEPQTGKQQTEAAPEAGTKIGMLRCSLADTTNLVVWSQATFECRFEPNSGDTEQYIGEISKIGIDLNFSSEETLTWAVLAPSNDIGDGALAGDYYGASADVAVGVGAGAKVLVGGFDESIMLQPVSVSTSEGVGAGAGIEQFELTSATQG
jgi:hypothetical protein